MHNFPRILAVGSILVLGFTGLIAGESAPLTKSAYFTALGSIESVVASYELTHTVQSDAGPVETVVTVDFQWSQDGLLYYAVPKVKGSKVVSPYQQFICFHNGKQMYSFSSEGMGIREWKKEKDAKYIEQFYKDNQNLGCAQPEEFNSTVKKLYENIYNGFFVEDMAIVAPPFMAAASSIYFSDGVKPARDFKPLVIGKYNLSAFAAPLVKIEAANGATEYVLDPFLKSRNSDFWNESMRIKVGASGQPVSVGTALKPKRGVGGSKIIAISQFVENQITSVSSPFNVDLFNLEFGSKDKKQWSVVVKSMSINNVKPDFASEGSDPSRYQRLVDLDTGMNIEK